jgi:hypothetical protein
VKNTIKLKLQFWPSSYACIIKNLRLTAHIWSHFSQNGKPHFSFSKGSSLFYCKGQFIVFTALHTCSYFKKRLSCALCTLHNTLCITKPILLKFVFIPREQISYDWENGRAMPWPWGCRVLASVLLIGWEIVSRYSRFSLIPKGIKWQRHGGHVGVPNNGH